MDSNGLIHIAIRNPFPGKLLETLFEGIDFSVEEFIGRFRTDRRNIDKVKISIGKRITPGTEASNHAITSMRDNQA